VKGVRGELSLFAERRRALVPLLKLNDQSIGLSVKALRGLDYRFFFGTLDLVCVDFYRAPAPGELVSQRPRAE